MHDLPLYDRLSMRSFFISGGLAVFFGLFSVLGTVMGVLMTVLSAMGGGGEEALIGVLLLGFYGLWMVVCLGVGSLHLWASIQLLRGREKGTWLWIAAGSGLLLGITVYCAPFGMVSGVLGVRAMLNAPKPDGELSR